MNTLSPEATATSTPVPGTPAMLAPDDAKDIPRSDSIVSASKTIADLQQLELDKKTSDSGHTPPADSINAAEKGKDEAQVDQRTHKVNTLSSLPAVRKSLLLLFFVSLLAVATC